MNDIIQLLPESVANQIAAGEVIQRPANVVKELVENSVDAGATTIGVYVIDAGRTLVQVIDNGKGMSKTDARLAFERHATSKIRNADDLFRLQTMGFRGEALPSIASVSAVELRTRRESDELGTSLSISASRFQNEEPCSCPVGCNVKVENLFYNVPARRKFLKSNTTELNNIITAFERIALVYPDIEFTFHNNGSELMNLKTGNIHQRIADIFGKKMSQDLLPVDVKTSMCNVYGFVGKPESAKKKCSHQYFFVNGRYMRHPYFAKAVMNAYERMVPSGDQVPFFLYFDVDPSAIDVNIHPTKTEIKFENEQAIWQILSAAVREAVGIFNEIPTIDFDTEGKPDIPIFDNEVHASATQGRFNPNYNPFRKGGEARKAASQGWEELFEGVSAKKPAEEEMFPVTDVAREPGSPLDGRSRQHYQYKGQYIVTTVDGGMMITDQCRAHMRVLYERYLRQVSQKKAVSQRMLFPEAVKFNSCDSALLDTIISEMESIGFELSPLGAGNYAINSVPVGLEGINPSVLVNEMVEDVVQSGTSAIEEINRSIAMSLSRRAAIPVGQVLSNEEMEDLLTNLAECENSSYTPDGKRVYVTISHTDIVRYFS